MRGFRYAKSWVHQVEHALPLETVTSDILQDCFTVVRKLGRVAIIGDYLGYGECGGILTCAVQLVRSQPLSDRADDGESFDGSRRSAELATLLEGSPEKGGRWYCGPVGDHIASHYVG